MAESHSLEPLESNRHMSNRGSGKLLCSISPCNDYLIMVLSWWLPEMKNSAKLGARRIQSLNDIKLQRHMVPQLELGLVSKDGHHLEDRSHLRGSVCGSNRNSFSLNLYQVNIFWWCFPPHHLFNVSPLCSGKSPCHAKGHSSPRHRGHSSISQWCLGVPCSTKLPRL